MDCLTFRLSGNLRRAKGRWMLDAPEGVVPLVFVDALQRQMVQTVDEPFDLEGEPVELCLRFPGRNGRNTTLL